MDITTLFKLSSGLYIIGTKDDEKNAGCVVNTVVQTTAQPVTLSVCIHKDNFTNACIKKTGEFAVSIISENIKENIIGAFGFSSSRDKDKFSDVSYGFTPSGMPYLKEGVTGFIQCKVLNFIDNFTHTIFISEVKEAENISKENPMTYEYYHRVIKGKTPKNASAYIEETQKTGGSYKCSICGYEFSGSKEEFEKLPDDYKCPICTVAKSLFKPI
ncbi:MAG: flavin reductase [Treponema sp.]|nr:flavin reductase [Treponema sp.]